MPTDIHELMEAFWAGEKPGRVPYTVYEWMFRPHVDDPVYRQMVADGLGATHSVATAVERRGADVEAFETTWDVDGRSWRRWTLRTPVGEVCREAEDGWTRKYWLTSAKDYRVMRYVVEAAEIVPAYDDFARRQNDTGPEAIVHPTTGARSPIQTILVDYCGLENFALHLYELADEVQALYEALRAKFRRRVEIVAGGPGRYVSVLENFTAETMGPRRYEQFHLPVYRECFPMLHQAGKIVGVHYDGRLSSCREAIAGAPVDLIESLTPPPEGDMPLAAARAAWPAKLFWSNVNLQTYDLPAEAIRQRILASVADAAADGRRLAFEVSEDLPANWRTAMPVILSALREAAG